MYTVYAYVCVCMCACMDLLIEGDNLKKPAGWPFCFPGGMYACIVCMRMCVCVCVHVFT